MTYVKSIMALAVAGAFVASAGADAAEVGKTPDSMWQMAAFAGPALTLAPIGDQRGVIEPPSSIDPGMAIDPPQTGAKMPIIHPPGMPDTKMILPR